jgi:fused signal recognition particle receptor
MTAEVQNEILFFLGGGVLTLLLAWVFISLFKRMKAEDQAQLKADLAKPSLQSDAEAVVEKSISSQPSAKAVVEDLSVTTKTLKEALSQTEKSLFGRIRTLFSNDSAKQNLEEIEEILYTSDLGPQTVETLMGAVSEKLSKAESANAELVKQILKTEFETIFSKANIPEPIEASPMAHLKFSGHPAVVMVVGVNGAGKTTSIGKIAGHLAHSGKRVLVAAGDTFRAAAGNQLKTWTDRAQVEIFSPEGVTDPSAVAFDAVSKGKAQGYDVVIVDTAGRLHTQSNLMEELKKMKRVITKVIPEAPHETLIVLDANSGQNALMQAREFHKALGLTGVVLTKMDGTAKGGVAVGLAHELKIPIRLIGVGEKIGDLRPFSVKEFVESIF